MSADLCASLTYDDAASAMDWLCKAFGFTQRLVVPGADGSIVHSELSLGEAVVMVSSPKPETDRVSPRHHQGISHSICVFTDDPDTHFQTAQAAGGEIIQEIKDEDYGCRGYMVKDPEGHVWYFSNYRPGVYWDD